MFHSHQLFVFSHWEQRCAGVREKAKIISKIKESTSKRQLPSANLLRTSIKIQKVTSVIFILVLRSDATWQSSILFLIYEFG